MGKDKNANAYGIISIINHWSIGLIFIVMLIFGFYLAYANFALGEKGPLMFWHKSIGASFIVLALWRILWRIFQGFPPKVTVMPLWQSITARVTHWLLLLSLLIMPASGIIMNLYSGRDLNIFNIITIPGQQRDETISGIAGFLHHNAPYAISAIILLHLAAALKHHYIDGDKTLLRMLGRD